MDKFTKKDYEELKAYIEEQNRKYYDEDDPDITDFEYDQLTQKLRKVEAEHPDWVTADSPSQHVGGNANENVGKKVTHEVPMKSLKDVFSIEEVTAFCEDPNVASTATEFVVEKKIDGLSISIEYVDGKYSRASTRGNGTIGEDVTENIKNVIGVPMELASPIPFLEVRGEVYMTDADFLEVNKRQEDNDKPLFKNPRNCAAGTIRQLDPKVVAERNLRIFVFNLQRANGKTFKTHSETLDWMAAQGFTVSPEYKICKTAEEVVAEINHIGDIKSQLEFPMDGAVVKVNSLDERVSIGENTKTPKWAVAYKYAPEQQETVVTNIVLQVGRTGRITPVAEIEPVELAGTTVSRATLHNQDQINRLDIGIGDTVIVQKAGEIIPEIVSVVKEKRPEGTTRYVISDTCPICGGKVEKDMEHADMRCTNHLCPAQLSRSIEFFASKEGMDIIGFGPSVTEKLLKAGYIKTFADIYTLKDKRDKLINEKIIGKEKTVDNLLTAIETSKTAGAAKVFAALGIRNSGTFAGKILFDKYESLDDIAKAPKEELALLDGIGEITASAITEFFANEGNQAIINQLKESGVVMTAQKKVTGSALAGLTFVITGTLPSMSRTEAKEFVENNGGKVSSSVSKKTSYLLAGEEAGSKLDKAKELGVKIITEAEIKEMVG